MGSAFMLIAAGVIIAAGFALPFLQKAQQESRASKWANERETVYVEGQQILGSSPFYYDIIEFSQTKAELEKSAATKADDAALELLEELLDAFLLSDRYIDSYDDYRYFVAMYKRQAIIDKFVLSRIDEYSSLEFTHILGLAGWYSDEQSVRMEYFDLDEKQKAKRLEAAEDELEMAYKVEVNNDYKAYYRNEINDAKKDIETLSKEIEALEKDIAENPDNEELYSSQIEAKKTNIKTREEIDIYLLEYRIENEITPFFSDWRSSAVDDKRNSMYDLHIKTLSREQFEENEYYRNEYRTYNAYLKQRQDYLNESANKLLIADRSLESGKPDMKYVLDGPRARSTGFLWYSTVISVFVVLIGGGLISREYKQGTIRLLLIRPKSRLKIIFYKTAALVAISFALYFVSAALNILANGIIYGFADYAYPNYTISNGASGISFFADYVFKFLVCFISVLFMTVLSVFLSAVTKNTAVSVAVPMVLMLGSLIFMMYFMSGMVSQRSLKWVFITPLPYINMFMYYVITDFWWEIKINIVYGTGLVSVLTAAAAVVGVLNFKIADIRN